MPPAKGPPSIWRFLEAPPGHALPTVDHRALFHDRMGSARRGCEVGADLRTRHSMDAAPYLNPARATYPGRLSELDAAIQLLHPPDAELEVREVTIFVEGAGETPPRPRPTDPVYDGTRPTPPYAVMCEAFPREPTWSPTLPPATHAPRGWAHTRLFSPLPRTRGVHHRGQALWQERPGTPLLLLVVTTRGGPERVLGVTPTEPLRGSARALPPPPGA